MLFLAVFAGFLVENQREHIVESQRKKIYTFYATLQQLKSSGALRYLGDTSIIRKILSYEESYPGDLHAAK